MSNDLLTACELVVWFNDTHPIGSKVTVYPATVDGRAVQTETRSAAWVLASGEPIVAVRGIAGGIHLSHIVCAKHPTHAREVAE